MSPSEFLNKGRRDVTKVNNLSKRELNGPSGRLENKSEAAHVSSLKMKVIQRGNQINFPLGLVYLRVPEKVSGITITIIHI